MCICVSRALTPELTLDLWTVGRCQLERSQTVKKACTLLKVSREGRAMIP